MHDIKVKNIPLNTLIAQNELLKKFNKEIVDIWALRERMGKHSFGSPLDLLSTWLRFLEINPKLKVPAVIGNDHSEFITQLHRVLSLVEEQRTTQYLAIMVNHYPTYNFSK